MTEHEFIKEIDCAFPYKDRVRSLELIDRGISISPNAAFMVLNELCRPPNRNSIEVGLLDELIGVWQSQFGHPLVSVVMPAVRAHIDGYDLDVSDALAAMKAISHYPSQFNALTIPYMACDDIDGVADILHQEIVSAWSANTSPFFPVPNDKISL